MSHALHGGLEGWSWRLWSKVSDAAHSMADPWQGESKATLLLSLLSEDGDEGYPGTVQATARFEVTDEDELLVTMSAEALERPTVVAMCNHSYFNLAGHASGDVLGHSVHIPSSEITLCDATGLPTGELGPVAGTPLDLTDPGGTPLAEPIAALAAAHAEGTEHSAGLDHNFVLAAVEEGVNPCVAADGEVRLAAVCSDPVSGRRMHVSTNAPGVQCFSANYPVFDGTLVGKGGAAYGPHAGVCFETQHWPDGVNQPHFPSALLEPARMYSHHWNLAFDADG